MRLIFLAMIPIIEQKVAIPVGILAHMDSLQVYFLTLIGAILPAPFIILFVTAVFKYLKQFTLFEGMVNKLEQRALSRSNQVEQYKMIGLLLFVAIPLPGTGVWTGSLIAALLGLEKKKAILAVVLGAIVCGFIILIFTQGVAKVLT